MARETMALGKKYFPNSRHQPGQEIISGQEYNLGELITSIQSDPYPGLLSEGRPNEQAWDELASAIAQFRLSLAGSFDAELYKFRKGNPLKDSMQYPFKENSNEVRGLLDWVQSLVKDRINPFVNDGNLWQEKIDNKVNGFMEEYKAQILATQTSAKSR